MKIDERTGSIFIEKSNTKLFFQIIVRMAFVVFGLFLIISPLDKNPPLFIKIIGYVFVILLGSELILLLKKIFSDNIGLEINNEGIIDNSTVPSIGLVEWNDIRNIDVIEINRQKFIMVYVKNTQNYIDKEKNKLKKKTMQMNTNMYGTPIQIVSNALKISHKELYNLLVDKFQEKSKIQTKNETGKS